METCLVANLFCVQRTSIRCKVDGCHPRGIVACTKRRTIGTHTILLPLMLCRKIKRYAYNVTSGSVSDHFEVK